jgi:hypothetical protein
MKNKKRGIGNIILCSSIFIINTGSAHATEGGGTVYPLGVNTVVSGKLAPEGFTSYVYAAEYQANGTKDNDGHNKENIKDFDLRIKAITLRLDYIYSGVSFFGAKVASRIAVPLVDGNVSFDVLTPAGRVHHSGSEQGLGDITLVPIMLGWNSPRYSQLIGVDVFTPTGSYDKNSLFNPGRNIWSIAPWYAFTACPFERVEISAKMLYFFNQKNSATDYDSGNEINIDYNIGYNITPEWQVGLNGYAYKQVQDDTQNGKVVSVNGNRGQVLAVGPGIKYQTKAVGLVMKWQHETMVENRAKGDRLWLQVAYHF